MHLFPLQSFGCGAVVLGDEKGNVPTIKWDFSREELPGFYQEFNSPGEQVAPMFLHFISIFNDETTNNDDFDPVF